MIAMYINYSDFQRLGSIVKSGQVPDHEEDVEEEEQFQHRGHQHLHRGDHRQHVPAHSSDSEQSDVEEEWARPREHDHESSDSGHDHVHQGQVVSPRKDTEETLQSNKRRESSLDKEDLSNRLEVLAKLEPLPALRDNLHQSRLQNGY